MAGVLLAILCGYYIIKESIVTNISTCNTMKVHTMKSMGAKNISHPSYLEPPI